MPCIELSTGAHFQSEIIVDGKPNHYSGRPIRFEFKSFIYRRAWAEITEYITPAAARQIAASLLEAAEQAEAREIPALEPIAVRPVETTAPEFAEAREKLAAAKNELVEAG